MDLDSDNLSAIIRRILLRGIISYSVVLISLFEAGGLLSSLLAEIVFSVFSVETVIVALVRLSISFKMSFFIIRPYGPVPLTFFTFIPSLSANF